MFTIRPRAEMIQALKDAAQNAQNSMILPWGESVLDHRDINRLLQYLTLDEAKGIFGDNIRAETVEEWGERRSWDAKTVTAHIKDSLEFAFEKALNQRGISASLMHTVMIMWMWVIQDDELVHDSYYSNYGLPYLYRIRDKYFPGMRVQ